MCMTLQKRAETQLLWSVKLPESEGWYWFKGYICGRVQRVCCFVYNSRNQLRVRIYNHEFPLDMTSSDVQWAGPIPYPEDV